jgi:Glycosyltransferase family 87
VRFLKHWWVIWIVGLVAVSGYVAMTAPLGGDYPGPACDTCDYAGPPIEALAKGDVNTFFEVQPVMGSVSLLLRTPMVALANAMDRDQLFSYRLGSLICLLVVAGLAFLLSRAMAERGQSPLAQGVVMGLVVGGPLTVQALSWGHPEEVLAAALCAGGVIAAARQRPGVAGVLLGLAFATKLWAWLALLPALIVLAHAVRLRFAVTAAGTAALFVIPMFLGDPSRFVDQIRHYSMAGNGLTPTNIWWVYGKESGISVSGGRASSAYAVPELIGSMAHLLILAIAIGLVAAYWTKWREREPMDVLLLVALIFLLRCMLDPLTYSYHHMPFFVALISYEALRRRGLPWVSMAVSGAVYGITQWLAAQPEPNPTAVNRLYLAWAIPTAAYLAFSIALPGGLKWERRALGESREPARTRA